MKKTILPVAVALAAFSIPPFSTGCTSARKEPSASPPAAGTGPGVIVLATFTGEVDPATGTMTIETESTIEGLVNGVWAMPISDPSGVLVQNDPGGSLWQNEAGHCPGDLTAKSSGRLVQVSTQGAAYQTPSSYLTGVYAQLTQISDAASSSCNSSARPSWILDDPGFGLWEYPYALAAGNYTSTTPWAFQWNSGAHFTFRGIVLAATYLSHFTPPTGSKPSADLSTAYTLRDNTMGVDGMGTVIFGTTSGYAMFDPWYSTFSAGATLPAATTSMDTSMYGFLWFTTATSSESTPAAYVGCSSTYVPSSAYTLGLGTSKPRGIACDVAVQCSRAWFVETTGPGSPFVGAARCDTEAGTVTAAGSFVPTSDGSTPTTPYFVATRTMLSPPNPPETLTQIYVTNGAKVLVYAAEGSVTPVISRVGDLSTAPCSTPMNVSVNPAGDRIFVSDSGDGKICSAPFTGDTPGTFSLYAEAPAGFRGGAFSFDQSGTAWMVLFDAITDLPRAVGLVVPGSGSAGTVIPYPLTSNASPDNFRTTSALPQGTGGGGEKYVFATAVDATGTASGIRRIEKPSVVSSLSFLPVTVAPGEGSTGTVVISSPAPAGGLTVDLLDLPPDVTTPSSVLVPAGQSSVTFPVTTSPTAFTAGYVLTAGYNSWQDSRNAQIDIVKVESVTLSPTSVAAGGASTGTVTINPTAMTGPVVVTLTSSDPSKVVVPATVTVLVNGWTAEFPVTTSPTTTPGSYTITATFHGVFPQTANLTVTP